MIKLLIISDDFTGALDTGVKFSSVGAATKISTDTQMDFPGAITEEVLVLCVPTRHLSAREAYDMIRHIVERAAQGKIRCIYKKTDSALRGNIGAELSAALDGSGEKNLFFIPALPGMNRITEAGIHYIDGVPASESVFGQDPFEPVVLSCVPDLVHLQCDVPVKVVSRDAVPAFYPDDEWCIYVFDCVDRQDMALEVKRLSELGCLKLLAGCAGLAECLPEYLSLTIRERPRKRVTANRLTVLCGSVNPISCSQMDYGERRGFRRVHIPASQLLGEGGFLSDDHAKMDWLWDLYCQFPYLAIDSLQDGQEQVLEETPELSREDIRQKISCRMGLILKELMDRGADACFMIIGGDTLLAFMDAIDCHELVPICELQAGVVLSQITYRGKKYDIISKSGGFGEEDLLVSLQKETGIPALKQCAMC